MVLHAVAVAVQNATRKLPQCNQCRKQTAITVGSIFSGIKQSLGIYFISQNK